MINIILYGDIGDDKLKNLIFKYMSKYFEINYICNDKFIKIGEGEKIFILDSDKIVEIGVDNSIIIFKNKSNLKNIQYISKNCTAIINSNSIKNLEILCKFQLKVLSCGFSQKDTLTFSSNILENCVVSLQRSVLTVNKNKIYPFDIPIEFGEELSSYDILSYIGLIVLLEKVDDVSKLFISTNSL